MLAMVPKNHPNRTRKRGVDDSVDDRETPPDVFEPLDREFGFTLDAAAARHNAKCKRYYARAANETHHARQLSLFPEVFIGDPEALGYDGLGQNWAPGEVVWCNPPYSDIEPWVAKAHDTGATVVMLLPANRCEQFWWQHYIEPYRDGRHGAVVKVETRFLDGRRCFKSRGQDIGNRTSKNPPFGVVVIVWDRRGPVPC